MSVKATNLLLLVVAVGIVVAILDLNGCFESKISAARAAALLKERDSAATKVECRGGADGWDYKCEISRSSGSFAIDINVNGSSITSQDAP